MLIWQGNHLGILNFRDSIAYKISHSPLLVLYHLCQACDTVSMLLCLELIYIETFRKIHFFYCYLNFRQALFPYLKNNCYFYCTWRSKTRRSQWTLSRGRGVENFFSSFEFFCFLSDLVEVPYLFTPEFLAAVIKIPNHINWSDQIIGVMVKLAWIE